MTNKSQRYTAIVFIALAIVWGSSFILIKKAIIAFSPLEVAALRISLSAMAFLPFLIKFWSNIDWSKWKYFLLVGLTGSGIPAFLYPIGQTEISSSIAGILNSCTPIFTFLLGILLFRSKFVGLKFVGIIIGIIGAGVLIFYGKDPTDIGGNPLYTLFIIGGTICYGLNINIVKSIFQNIDPLKLSAVSFSMIGPPALLFLLVNGSFSNIDYSPELIQSAGAIVFLSIFGTVISTVLFFKLVQGTSAVFASSVAYIIPIVALFWGFLDGESIGLVHLLGMGLILTGVYLIRKS